MDHFKRTLLVSSLIDEILGIRALIWYHNGVSLDGFDEAAQRKVLVNLSLHQLREIRRVIRLVLTDLEREALGRNPVH